MLSINRLGSWVVWILGHYKQYFMNIFSHFLRLNIGDSLGLWLLVGWFWDKLLLCSPAWVWTNVSTPLMRVGVTSMFHTWLQDFLSNCFLWVLYHAPIMYQHLFFYNHMKSGNYQNFHFCQNVCGDWFLSIISARACVSRWGLVPVCSGPIPTCPATNRHCKGLSL